MTETEIIALAREMDGVVVLTATAESGAPEVAWGDSFIYYDPTTRRRTGSAVRDRGVQ